MSAGPGTRRPPVVPAGPRLAARAQAERSQRRRRLGRRLTVVVAAIAVFAGLAWVVFSSPLLAVRHVVVVGAARLSEGQVTAAAGVRAGMPLTRVDTDQVARRVGRLAAVADVSVTRSWPRTLRVHVTERAAVAAVPSTRGVLLVDSSGAAFAAAPAAPPGVVRLDVGRPGPADPATTSALRVLAELPDSLRGRVLAVRAPSPDAVTLVLRDRRQVVWGGPGDGVAKAAATEALLRLKGTVVDVSTPGLAVRR